VVLMKKLLFGILLATALAFGHAQAQDNSKILFTERNYNRPSSIQTRLWIVNPDGSELKKLSDSISNTNREISKASFSPDGNMITFQSVDGKQKIIDLDGKELYSFNGGNRSNEDFVWTPDGKAILCGKYVDGLYKFNLENDTLIRIKKTLGFTYDHNPVMSPNLEKIIFTHHEYEKRYYNYVMDTAGTRLITSSYGNDTIFTSYDEQLGLTWMDDNNMLFTIPSKDVIGYFSVDSVKGRNFFPGTDFKSVEVSQDRKSIAIVPSPYTKGLAFVDIASLDSDSLKITDTDIDGMLAMTYSSDNKIFCISQDKWGSAPYDPDRRGLFTYDENMNRHLLLRTANLNDSIGNIEFIEWNSKPVKTSDLGVMDPLKYSHSVNGHALSSIPEKIIISNAPIYLSQAPGDTIWANTSYGWFSFNWKSTNRKQDVTIGSKNVPGHMSNEATYTIDDYEPVNITFTGITYNLTKPVQIRNQYSETVSGANVTGGDSTVITENNGRVNVIKSNLTTNSYNLPLEKYKLALAITKSNIQTSNQSIDVTIGANPESILNVVQEYEQWLYGTNTTPSGATVKGQKNGTTIYNGTVNGTSYETNHIKQTTKTYTLAEVIFSAPQYNSQIIPNVTLTDGGNKLEATLSPITSVEENPLELILNNYPNPFINNTNIMYELSEGADVILKVYNVLGQEKFEIIEKNQNAGVHNIQFDGSNLSPGIYIYKLQAGYKTSSGKMIKR
jgi:hypothetical protein